MFVLRVFWRQNGILSGEGKENWRNETKNRGFFLCNHSFPL